VVILALAILAAGAVHSIPSLAMATLLAGAGWLVFISLISALAQTLAPDWARARVMAVLLLTYQGGIAAGSAIWGALAGRVGIPMTFACASLATLGTIAIAFIDRLPETTSDTTPWNHWRLPAVAHEGSAVLDHAAVLVTVRYHVREHHEQAFLAAMEHYGRVRRRDGASWWNVFRDLEQANVFLETFLVTSWAEHVRQHERFTQGDRDIEDRVRTHVEEEPITEHLIQANSGS
jgi:MFS family permease